MRPQQMLGFFIFTILAVSCKAQTFSQQFVVPWGSWNVFPNDYTSEVTMQLKQDSGAQFQSSGSYLYGHFSVRLKLIPYESAGTVTAFYLTSFGDYHDEIDFEFLGNETGQPYALHTNLFVNGVGNREQRCYLWFDPTVDFHTYALYWNHNQILWTVDGIPIRVHKNKESEYPNTFPYYQPMVVSSSMFDASSWATRGGLVPVKWEHAPFVATFSNFIFNACQVYDNNIAPCNVNWEANYWEAPEFAWLNATQAGQLNWVRSNYYIYDYCTDSTRFPVPPQECYYNVV